MKQDMENITHEPSLHFEENSSHPILNSVIKKETSFVGEVEGFYDMGIKSSTYSPLILKNLWFGEEDTDKRGTFPKNLVDILDEDNEEDFDVDKLKYDSVREDYLERKSKTNEMRKDILHYKGLQGLSVNMGTSLLFSLVGIPEMIIPFGFFGAGFLLSGYLMGNSLEATPKNHSPLDEYIRLHETAKYADHVVQSD